jgi:cytochrome P450
MNEHVQAATSALLFNPLSPDFIRDPHPHYDRLQGNAANLMAQMHFQLLFDLRRRNPGDDLTTQLVQAEEDGC